MDEQKRLKILSGRLAVDAYRLAHAQLHSRGWHKGIPDEHTPLLKVMLKALGRQSFNSLGEFEDASEELNAEEFGDAEKGWK